MTLPKPCARHPGPVRCRAPGFQGSRAETAASWRATNIRNSRRLERTLHELGSHPDGDSEEILEALRRLEEALRKTLAS